MVEAAVQGAPLAAGTAVARGLEDARAAQASSCVTHPACIERWQRRTVSGAPRIEQLGNRAALGFHETGAVAAQERLDSCVGPAGEGGFAGREGLTGCQRLPAQDERGGEADEDPAAATPPSVVDGVRCQVGGAIAQVGGVADGEDAARVLVPRQLVFQ